MDTKRNTERIASYKKSFSRRLKENAIGIIAYLRDAVSKRLPLPKIRNEILLMGRRLGLPRVLSTYLCNVATHLWRTWDGKDASELNGKMERSLVWENCSKLIWKQSLWLESGEKERMLEAAFRKAMKSGRALCLCSKHGDCANDHGELQGRLYLLEGWKGIVSKEDAEWLSKTNYQTMQRAMEAPAYLIKRPNCRHYLVFLRPSEAKGKSAEELLQIHHASHPKGSRTMKLSYENNPKYDPRCEEIEFKIAFKEAISDGNPKDECDIRLLKRRYRDVKSIVARGF